MKQLYGPESVKHSQDQLSLEGPQPQWKKAPQRIELPSNLQRTRNPLSGRISDNLHEVRGPSSSLTRPISSGNSRINPSSTNVIVTSSHFSQSYLAPSTMRDHFKSEKNIDSLNSRPSKRRKTEIGSAGPSQTFLNRPHVANGKGFKSSVAQTYPNVIDLAGEDIGEPISTGSLGSPLTPTLSSDDIGLRSRSHRRPSPSVSELTDPNSPLHAADNDDPVGSTGSQFSEGKGKFVISDAPHIQYLTEKFKHATDDNADDFDNLSLKDSTSNRSRKNGGRSLPKGFVKKAVADLERNAAKLPPFVNIAELMGRNLGRNLVHSMKTKNSTQLRRTSVEGLPTVSKPPLKPDNAISSTDFVRSGIREVCVPLSEFVCEGQVYKTTEEDPLSANFDYSTINILKQTSIIRTFSIPMFDELMFSRSAADFVDERVVIFTWLLRGEPERLGLKFQQIKNDRLCGVYNFINKLNLQRREFVTKGTCSAFWSHLTSISTNSSPTRKAKPRPSILHRPATRLASRESLTRVDAISSDANRAKRSPSPSSEELILVYPPSGTGALNITYGDLKRLEPGEFLNDTLIEFGLKLWLNDFRSMGAELADQIHVFSSFFYTQLHQKNFQEGYNNVRKWTSRVDIFKKDYVIVPINENLHWYLAVICYPGRILQNEEQTTRERKGAGTQTEASSANGNDENANLDSRVISPLVSPSPSSARSLTRSASPPSPIGIVSSQPDPMDVDESVVNITLGPSVSQLPYIFTFDSLGTRHLSVLKTLTAYLCMEAKDKKQFTVSRETYTTQALVPTQPNSCDCGIYLLHFVEQFMSDPERHIKYIINKSSRFTRKSWSVVKSEREQFWNAAEVSGKREALKEKMIALSTEWKQMRKPDDKGKAKEEAPLSGPPVKGRDEDSDIEVVEVTTAPSTSRSSKQRVQRLR